MTKTDYFPVDLDIEWGAQPSAKNRSRKRLVYFALAAAALLATVAIVLPSYVADRLIKFPADIHPVELSDLLPARGRLTLPAQTVGRSGDEETITMSLYYSATRDFWVDPVTGAIIVVSEHQRRYLATAVDDPALVTVFEGSLRFDEETIEEMVTQSQEAREQIAVLRRYGPVAAAITAMAALAFGVWRLRRSGRCTAR